MLADEYLELDVKRLDAVLATGGIKEVKCDDTTVRQ